MSSETHLPAGRFRGAGWNGLVCLLALLTFEVVLARVASPFQGGDKVEKKFAYFAAQRDDYDLVFVGSSRAMNQVSPKVFDAQMAARGRACRSFNLGVSGMFLPECSFLMDQIRARPGARLRTMVVELSSPAPRHDADDPVSEREVYWHHLAPTALACAALWTDLDSPAVGSQRAAQIWLQTTLCARCLVRLGDGLNLLEQWHKRTVRREAADAVTREIGPAHDGFFPMAYTLGRGTDGVARTGGAADERRAFEAAVEKLRVAEATADVPAAVRSPAVREATALVRAILARTVRSLRAAGIEPIFFIAPGTNRELVFRQLHEDGTLPVLLRFNDPAAYPDLYETGVRADRNHLNAAGAERFSRRLADAVAAVTGR